MKTLDLVPDTQSYRFFKELREVLPTLRCDNGICQENNLITAHMYLLEHKNDSVNFNVLKSHVCCAAFDAEIRKKADSIYEKYKS